MSSAWRSLERDFRDIPDTFGDLRADWSTQPQIPNDWRLAGGSSREVRDRFEALARLAGNLLASSPGTAGRVSNEILAEADSFTRWLMAVRQLTGRFESGLYGVLRDESGAFTGNLFTGSIPKVIDASALACLQLAAEDSPVEQHGGSSARVFIDEIDSFAKVRDVDAKEVLPLLTRGRLEVEEDSIQGGDHSGRTPEGRQ